MKRRFSAFLGLLAAFLVSTKVLGDQLQTWYVRQAGNGNYENLNDVASGIQGFVAVGNHGTVYSSVRGDSWIRQSSPVTNDLTSVAYGNGVFVAVGNGTIQGGGTMIVSTNDGTSWQNATNGAGPYATKVIFQNGLFLMSINGAAFTSSDGRNWVSQVFDPKGPLPPPVSWMDPFSEQRDFTGGSGLFLLVGSRGYVNLETSSSYSFGAIWTSAGQGWKVQTFNEGDLLSSAVFGNGRFLVTGKTNVTSTDGANWSPWNPPAGIKRIVFGNGTFLAMSGGRSQHGASGNSHLTSSTNGLDWTAGPSLTSNALLGGCYGQGTFVLVGAYGTIVQSADFISPQLEQSRFVDGRFEASVTGEVGRRYHVQTATNLAASNWRDLIAFTNSLPTRQFSDRGATNNPSRFYRVVSP